MNPVCVTCAKEMRCLKNGVYVQNCENISDGDIYACEACGSKVATGFGRPRSLDHRTIQKTDTLISLDGKLVHQNIPDL